MIKAYKNIHNQFKYVIPNNTIYIVARIFIGTRAFFLCNLLKSHTGKKDSTDFTLTT